MIAEKTGTVVAVQHDRQTHGFVLEELTQMQIDNLELFLQKQKEGILGRIHAGVKVQKIEQTLNDLKQINEQLDAITNYRAAKR